MPVAADLSSLLQSCLDLHSHAQLSNRPPGSPTVKGPSTCAPASPLPLLTTNYRRAHPLQHFAATEFPDTSASVVLEYLPPAADDISSPVHCYRASRRLPELYRLLTEQ